MTISAHGFKLLYILTSLMVVWSGCKTEGTASGSPVAEFTAHLDERIPSLMKTYDIPGASIALVHDGKTEWVYAYGNADLESGRKMTPDTYCRVESISKSVTAWGVMKLVQEGKLDLDRPVVEYLNDWEFPYSEFSGERITTRQLLSQSSGLALGTIGVLYAPGENKPSLETILTRDAILIQEPGKFSYSNAGFNVLELMISRITGEDFALYMQEEVLQPLSMDHSTFNWNDSLNPEVPNGYDLRGKSIPVYVYPDKAAGGLFSAAGDIAGFVAAGMPDYNSKGTKVLDKIFIESLYENHIPLTGYYNVVFDGYGFGHFVEILPNGMKSVANGGQGSGWMTHFQFVPESGDGIIILTNSQRSWPFFAHVLSDWAEWRGFGGIGMGKILVWTKALWVIGGLILCWVVVQTINLVSGLIRGNRKILPFSERGSLYRMAQLLTAVILMTALVWVFNQPYFFMFSVFPGAADFLVWVIFLLALVLTATAMLPKVGSVRRPNYRY